MARPSSKARLAMLGEVLKLLRQRRRPVHAVVIKPDGTIEVRLGPPSEVDLQEAELRDELERFRRSNGY